MDSKLQDKLDAYLEKKNLRRTPQRQEIVEVVFSSDEHFMAEELVDRVRKKNPQSSRATVYRTINLLIDAGLLHEIDLGDDNKHYDPNFTDMPDHAHLICVDCGKVLEFSDDNLKLVEDCLVRRMGFRPANSALRVEACCDQLRRTGRCESLIEARLSGKRMPKRRK